MQLLLNSYKESENRASLASKINACKLRNQTETHKTMSYPESPDRLASTVASPFGMTIDARHEQPSVGQSINWSLI
jgi:hypothetical protein